MARKPHREAFIESNTHLKLRFMLSMGAVTLLAVWMQVTVAGESLEPGDLLLSVVMATVGGGGASVVALILGSLVRWQSLPRSLCRGASVALALVGFLTVIYAIQATDASPRDPLGIAEERHGALNLLGLLVMSFGIANRPPRLNLG
jgi:hypothetical protein